MRRAIWIILIITAAVGFALVMRLNHANLTVLWPPYRVDVSMNLAIVVLVLAFLAGYLLLSMVFNAWNLPGRVREYRERRRRERALIGLRDSLLAYFEGRFGRAERLARAALADHTLAGSAALIGARAAQCLQEPGRRDGWLESARLINDVDSAYRSTMAEVALDENRPGDALAEIDDLRVRGIRTAHSLRLALRAHEQLGNWDDVLDTLRQLERRDLVEPAFARTVRVRALRAAFAQADDDHDRALKLWNELPEAERELEEVVPAATAAMIRAGRHDQAARMIERVLASRFDASLVSMWPDLDAIAGRTRLKRAENWLQQWGEEPALLVALGRLCADEELWGKAEEFLERAQRRHPDARTQMLLARLCEHLGRDAEAARWYREAATAGLASETPRLFVQRLPALPAEPEPQADADASSSSEPVAPLPSPKP